MRRTTIPPTIAFPYGRIYGAWWERVVERDEQAAVARSAERYLAAIAE